MCLCVRVCVCVCVWLFVVSGFVAFICAYSLVSPQTAVCSDGGSGAEGVCVSEQVCATEGMCV